jgi:S1-C subfamily serine protease
MNVFLRRCLIIVCLFAATENYAAANVWTTLFGGGSKPLYDSDYLPSNVKQHPAVARIIVPEGGCTAFGSGTLVGVREDRGLVVTNWHVVKDSAGVVEVAFPDGFRSHARPLKVDQDWDLAALVIWRPTNIEPVKISAQPPRPGDPLTIHG